VSTDWGYWCRTCDATSQTWLSHGEDRLARLWALRHCVATLHGAADGFIEVDIIGCGTSPAWWVTKHWQHAVALENEHGDRRDLETGRDLRNYDDAACGCPAGVVTATSPQDDDPVKHMLKAALQVTACEAGVEADFGRWHWWWDTGQELAGHVPPEPRPGPHHDEGTSA
jgi:hypothetical protein